MAASNDTYVGSLEVLLKQVAVMSGLADANLPWVMQLMQMIQNEMRSPDVLNRKAGIAPQPQMADQLPGMPMGAPPPGEGPQIPQMPDALSLQALLGA